MLILPMRTRMYTDHTYLVIGLGSMGRRRSRCLKSLGAKKIHGFDLRADRIEQAAAMGVTPIEQPAEFLKENQDVRVFICVPPDKHQEYMDLCLETSSHFFVEAGIEDEGHQRVIEKLTSDTSVKGVPSCTLLFHPAIQKISEIVKEGQLGKISNVLYHSGQYLPDWHPEEPVSEYYVSNPETGAAREIVPFELTWLAKVFGTPEVLAGTFGKTITIDGAEEIDDTYTGVLKLGNSLCNLTVDVVSRYATRLLTVNGSEKQLRWNWDDDHIKVFDPKTGTWETVSYAKDAHEEGYNPNIPEQMYIDEVQNFIDYSMDKRNYPTDFKYDVEILTSLKQFEQSGAVTLR